MTCRLDAAYLNAGNGTPARENLGGVVLAEEGDLIVFYEVEHVQVDGAAVAVLPDGVVFQGVRHGLLGESLGGDETDQLWCMLALDEQVDVVVWPCLTAYERIDAPASVEPDLDLGIRCQLDYFASVLFGNHGTFFSWWHMVGEGNCTR